MGAVTFSLDSRLVKALRSKLVLSMLAETGTFKGDTVEEFLPSFDKLISIELSAELWGEAVKRFEVHPNVRILQGNSPDKLKELRPELQDMSVLYWLDAHWCAASNTAGERSQCPLLGELNAIGRLNQNSVILIDDARLFLAPPLAPHEISQWPCFQQIVSHLLSMSSHHEMMVVNDVIAFFPMEAKGAMTAYAQYFGADWLLAANCLLEYGSYMRMLEGKESFIQQQESIILQKENLIHAKDAVIQQQARAIRAYRTAYGGFPPLRLIARGMRRTREIVWPRLGNLNQYAPRPLTTARRTINKALRHFPLISITTPSFGQSAFIERTLLSVLHQQYPQLQYYVQDGGSNDGTADVLKKYQNQISGWVSEKDSGQSQAINRGLAKTSGEIMAWLNSDDLLLPGALHTVADYFNRHPDVDVVYGNRLLIDEHDMEIGRWIIPGHDSEVLSWVDFVPQETLFWRRRIWDKVGGQIDESFHFAMDWDLLVRFREAGAKFAHIPQYLGAFRIHDHQKTSCAINDVGHQEMNRIREHLLGRVPSHREIRKAVLPFLIKHVAVDMAYRVKTRLGVKP